MVQKLTRRTMLAAAAAAGLGGTVAADHGHRKKDDRGPDSDARCKNCNETGDKHTGDTRVCTYRCGEPTDHQKDYGWWDSVLTAQNCSPCARKVNVRVDGCIHDSQYFEGDIDDLPQSVDILLGADERISVYFQGSMTNLETEPGDINIGITQRSVQDAHHCE